MTGRATVPLPWCGSWVAALGGGLRGVLRQRLPRGPSYLTVPSGSHKMESQAYRLWHIKARVLRSNGNSGLCFSAPGDSYQLVIHGAVLLDQVFGNGFARVFNAPALRSAIHCSTTLRSQRR